MQRKSLVVSVIAVGVTLSTGYALAQRGPGWDMGAGMQMGRGPDQSAARCEANSCKAL